MDKKLKSFCRNCKHISECDKSDFVCEHNVKQHVLKECANCYYFKTCNIHIYNRFGCFEIMQNYKKNILPKKPIDLLEYDIENADFYCPFTHTDLKDLEKMYDIIFAVCAPYENQNKIISANDLALRDYINKQEKGITKKDKKQSICSTCKENCGFLNLEIQEFLKRTMFNKRAQTEWQNKK